MGEMADDFLDGVMHMEDLRLGYRMGQMSSSEAFECGIIDEDGCEPYPITTKKCRCCGEGNLRWGNYKGKWRLFGPQGLHNCPKNPLKD